MKIKRGTKFFPSRLNSKSSERIEFEIIYSSSGFFLPPKNKGLYNLSTISRIFTLNVALFIFYVTQFRDFRGDTFLFTSVIGGSTIARDSQRLGRYEEEIAIDEFENLISAGGKA